MSIEKAMLERYRPAMLAARTHQMVGQEIVKGCQPDLATQPIALEPAYFPLDVSLQTDAVTVLPNFPAIAAVEMDDLVRLRVWVSPQQKCDWHRSERLLKQLYRVEHHVGLEIVGNDRRIDIMLLCHARDLSLLMTACQGEFERCALTLDRNPMLTAMPDGRWRRNLVFRDYYPPPPYSHLLTRPDELKLSAYGTLMSAMAHIQPPALGLYQILMQPVSPDHNWHYNVQRLLDIEFSAKLMSGWQSTQRLPQQTPSGDLRNMASDTQIKAHDDKPFFAAALRVAVIGSDEAHSVLKSLTTFSSLIQHGGRPLDWLTETDYQAFLDVDEIKQMFMLGQSYRPGFLVNSWELTSLAHIPPAEIAEFRPRPLDTLETLAAPGDQSLAVGTPVGTCQFADRNDHVSIPRKYRCQHVHIVGRPGCGKSTLLEHMFRYDTGQGDGAAVIDPHGELAERLLRLVPAEHADRVIYIDPGDRKWVPMWNPLRCRGDQEPGRVADDLVRAFRSFVDGWGDRLAHLLRQAILGVLHLPNGSLLDVANLLRRKSNESEQLRKRVLALVEHQVTRLFWQKDFDNYSKADLAPPQHKLSKLLSEGPVSWMLSQPESAVDFRSIMDEGRILIVNLSNIGTDVRDILGSFMLSLMHQAAVSRSQVPGSTYRPFHIFCDEAHRFVTDAVEDLIAETRKFKVSLTLAHQYMSQFTTGKTHAVSSVNSTVIFNVNSTDAGYLMKDLQGRVEPEELTRLEVGQAVARIGPHIVRIKTYDPLIIPQTNLRDQIVEQSRRRYCRPVEQIKESVRQGREPGGTLTPQAGMGHTELDRDSDTESPAEVYEYDEL